MRVSEYVIQFNNVVRDGNISLFIQSVKEDGFCVVHILSLYNNQNKSSDKDMYRSK